MKAIKTFKVEILFHTSARPKVVDALNLYTKDALLCVQLDDARKTIVKYPLCNVFQVSHAHGGHAGSSQGGDTPGGGEGDTPSG